MVSGKGGVGKSTFAAGLAHHLADKGLRTLLVELGDHSYFEMVYGKSISFHPTSIMLNLDLAIWSGESCLREFIAHYIPVKTIVNLFFENKIMKSLVKAAPALQELALLGKLTSMPRQIGPTMAYDRIILDGYSSGHFLSLLRVPQAMAETIKFGPMGSQSQSIHDTLINEDICKFIWVTTSEELPAQETCEFTEALKSEFSINTSIYINKSVDSLLETYRLNQDGLRTMKSPLSQYLLNITKSENTAEERFIKLNKKYLGKVPLALEKDSKSRILSISKGLTSHDEII
jgi:anion-transporting  ArsA/GET3 family ATPase